MSIHKAYPDGEHNPSNPDSVVMSNGRGAVPHAQVNEKPILGGIQNATVEVPVQTPEEQKSKVQEYHAGREEIKKAAKEAFDPKTGKPKVEDTFVADPVSDAVGTEVKAPTEEGIKAVEAEKPEAKKSDKK